MKYLLLKIILLINSILLHCYKFDDNIELKQLYQQDQQERASKINDYSQLALTDEQRLQNVYNLLFRGRIRTPKDCYHSAMIFQHGKKTSDYKIAIQLMKFATQHDHSINKWLLAAAIDRELMSNEKPQIYGTQFINTGKFWKRYKIDTTKISDFERLKMNVSILSDQQLKENELNKGIT